MTMLFDDAGTKLHETLATAMKTEGLDTDAKGDRCEFPDLSERRNRVIQAVVEAGAIAEDVIEVLMAEGLWDGGPEEVITGSPEDLELTEQMSKSYRDWVALKSN